MGRNRTFIEAEVLNQCAAVFRNTGYEGTSIDDLVGASGLHRGSLYKAFGSKRGLFVLALRQSLTDPIHDPDALDLLLVALMELAPRDPEIRAITFDILNNSTPARTAETLGRRLLERANLTHATSESPKESA